MVDASLPKVGENIGAWFSVTFPHQIAGETMQWVDIRGFTYRWKRMWMSKVETVGHQDIWIVIKRQTCHGAQCSEVFLLIGIGRDGRDTTWETNYHENDIPAWIDVVSVLEAKNHSSVLTRDSVSGAHSGDRHRIIKKILVGAPDQISKEKQINIFRNS